MTAYVITISAAFLISLIITICVWIIDNQMLKTKQVNTMKTEDILKHSDVLVNNPKICIKNLGATFVCVCPECMEKSRKLMEEYMNQHLQT